MATLHAWFFMLVRRFRWHCLAAVLVLTGIAAAVLLKTDFSADMLNLLPPDAASRQKLDTVIQSGILNKATLYFSKKDGSPFTEKELDAFLPQTMAKLKNLPGISAVKPKAAFYIFPKIDVKKFNITDDEKFALDLLRDKKILIVHGKGFNWNEPDHFRVVYLPRIEVLTDAVDKLSDFLAYYKQ